VLTLAVAGLAAAGCSGTDEPVAAPTVAAPTATTTAAAPRTTAPTRTTAKPTTSRPTPPPVTSDADCPYADRELMSGTVGQRIGRTTVTRTRPHVGCGYYRGDGEKAVDIAVSVLGSAAAAQARAIALVGKSANPVDGVADGGAVAVIDNGTLLAVSKGATLVVVRVNQRVPLEAVEIAKLVVAKV
jgi:Domain of unknown function (DUF2020)